MIAPLFGRQALVWLVDAGSFGVTVAYAFVAWSFLALRKSEPNLARPYRVPAGRFVGLAALVSSIAIAVLFMPGSPAALIWPYEWAIVIGWWLFGVAMLVFAPNHDHV